MRLLEIDNVKPGMELGRTIYSPMGQVMLRKGIVLREAIIDSLRKQNYHAVYVDDAFSADIDIVDVIDEELRNETVQKLKNLFVTVEKGGDARLLFEGVMELNKMISQIVDQVFHHRRLVVNLLDLKNHDDYTFRHSVNVSTIATVLGVAIGYAHTQLVNLARGALFHDIGKMFVSGTILNKPGVLTSEEFEIVKEHPLNGFNYVKTKLGFSAETSIGILQHHERYNGSGYPKALAGRKIHRNAQIIAISDVFDAMTSKRAYHSPILPSEAVEYIMGNVGQHFDAEIVDVFLKKVPAYPLGVGVCLSNGMAGLVCENYEGLTMRPKVKVYTDSVSDPKYIDLRDKEHSSVTITGVLRT